MSGGSGATWLDRVDEEKDAGKGPVANNSHDSPSNFQQARNSSPTTTILSRPIHYGGAAAALEQVLVKVFPSSSVLPLLVPGLSLRMVVNHAQSPGTGIFNPSRPHDAAAPP